MWSASPITILFERCDPMPSHEMHAIMRSEVEGVQLEHAERLVPNAVRSDFASGGPMARIESLRRGWCAGIQQLGNGGDELRRREGLGEKDAIGNSLRRPFVGAVAGHVDDRQIRLVLPRMPGDGPAIPRVLAKIDVGHERPEIGVCGVKQANRLFARGRYRCLESAICKGFLDHALYQLIVFDDQDHNLVFQRALPLLLRCSALGV